MRKCRLFGGFLIDEGVTVAKTFLPRQAAINHGFAQAELGRPARGFDVAQAMQAWDADQLTRNGTEGRVTRAVVGGLRAPAIAPGSGGRSVLGCARLLFCW